MKKIYFRNLNSSSMSLSSPAWQADVLHRVQLEYAGRAVAVSNEIERKFKEAEYGEGYIATTFDEILRSVPRYCYIKHIEDGFGGEYDAEIDLALHTVQFIKVNDDSQQCD